MDTYQEANPTILVSLPAAGGNKVEAPAAGTPFRFATVERLLAAEGANRLEAAVRVGRVLPGDVLLFARRGLVQAGIRFAQRRALHDLNVHLGLMPAEIAEAATYTHAAMAFDAFRFAEQTSPRARFGEFSEVERGIKILVRRPHCAIGSSGVAGVNVSRMRAAWMRIIGSDYPEAELFYYWFRWSSKLLFHRRFAEAFKDKRHHVCSGTVVEVLQESAGLMRGESPEAWYPARLAVDGPFVTVCTIAL